MLSMKVRANTWC